MQYAAIYFSSKPWSGDKVFLGLVAQDPKNGDVKVFRDHSWRRRVQNSVSPVLAPTHSGERAVHVAERFLESLHRLAHRTARNPRPATVDDVLRNVQDRGTSCQLGSASYGEFSTLDEALKFCRVQSAKPWSERQSIRRVGLGRPLPADALGA